MAGKADCILSIFDIIFNFTVALLCEVIELSCLVLNELTKLTWYFYTECLK